MFAFDRRPSRTNCWMKGKCSTTDFPWSAAVDGQARRIVDTAWTRNGRDAQSAFQQNRDVLPTFGFEVAKGQRRSTEPSCHGDKFRIGGSPTPRRLVR